LSWHGEAGGRGDSGLRSSASANPPWLDEYNSYGTVTYNGVKTAIAVDDGVWG
jgi:hypothetical protein